MTSRRLLQILSKIVPGEKITLVLSAFKHNPILWQGLQDTNLLERIDTDWKSEDNEFTPAALACFLLDSQLLEGLYPEITPSSELLEEVMLEYEQFLQEKHPVNSFRQAACLAVAVTEKYKLDEDWNKLLREIITRQTLETSKEMISYWGAAFAILCGWLDDRSVFLQALLQVKQPEFGYPVAKHLVYCLPMDEDERIELFKTALAAVTLGQQVTALQSLRQDGRGETAQQVAKGLFGRYLVGNLEDKKASEVWKNSEKSLNSSIYTRQLAALAQMAGEFEIAGRLLQNSEKILAAELAGVQIQKTALRSERGDDVSQEKSIIDHPLLDEDVAEEFSRASDTIDLTNDDTDLSMNADLQDALTLTADADESVDSGYVTKSINFKTNLAQSNEARLRALNWTPRIWLDKLMKLGLWSEAQNIVKELLDAEPTDLNLLNQSVEIAQALDSEEDCLAALEDMTVLDRENSSAKRLLAKVYEKQANWESAFENYDELVNHFASDETDDLLGYAQAAIKNIQPTLAIQAAEKVLAKNPENGQALAILGFAEHQAGESEKALMSLSRSVELSPELTDPWLLLAEVYRENGEMARSIDTLRTAKAAVPGEIKIAKQLANELLAQGQASEALTVLNSDASPQTPKIDLALLKIAAMKQLNLPELDDTIEKTYRDFPQEPEAIHAYATSLLNKGESASARKLIETQALSGEAKTEWKLTYADAILGQDYRITLGAHQAEKNLQEKAGQLLSEVQTVDPENIYANIISGEACLKNGQAEKAFNIFSSLLNNSEAQSSNWLERIQAGFAWAANLLGKFNYALAAIQNVVEARPDWAGARETLAEVSANSGELEEALEAANQVLLIAPDVMESVEWFADFMNNLGKAEEAEKAILALSKTHSQKLPLLLKLAEIKLKSGDAGEAKKIAESCIQPLTKTKSDKELLLAANLFDRLEDSDYAAECLKMRLAIGSSKIQNVYADLAGYLRTKGKLEQTLTVLSQMRQKFGRQTWLDLIEAETQHEKGESEKAFEALGNLSDSNLSVPETLQMNFIPAAWQPLLQANAKAEFLSAALAFETGNYQQALESLASENLDAAGKILKIEAGYALGNEKDALKYLEADAQDETIYKDPNLNAQIVEFLMDADQFEKAGLAIPR